jgi:hypothetical protein
VNWPAAKQRLENVAPIDVGFWSQDFFLRPGCSRVGVRLAYRAWSLHALATESGIASMRVRDAAFGVAGRLMLARASGEIGPIAQSVRAPGS